MPARRRVSGSAGASAAAPPVVAPTRAGFGTHLIERGLAAELEAEVKLEYAPDWFVFTMSSPLETLKEYPDLVDASA